MNKARKLVISLSSGIVLYACSFMHFSTMLGTYKASFSVANIAWPVVASFFPGSFMFGFLALLGGLKIGGLAFVPLMSLTHGIPTLASIFSLKAHDSRFAHFVMHVAVPALCIALFALHPVGSHALAYSAYWLIPVALWIAKKQNIIARALSATFVAHAVGSVMWLYTLETTSTFWLALIPVVAIERLMMTGAISGLCIGIQKAQSLFLLKNFKKNTLNQPSKCTLLPF